MAAYDGLKLTVAGNLPDNNNNEITAAIHRATLGNVIDELGELQFPGVAEPSDNPNVGDKPRIFLASSPGLYPNFGGYTVLSGEVKCFKFSGATWSQQTLVTSPGNPIVDFDTSHEIVIPPLTQLVDIAIWVDNPQTIKIGETNGSNEYYELDFLGGEHDVFKIALFSIAGQSVWVTGGLGIHIKFTYA